jgi:hypothetical protein
MTKQYWVVTLQPSEEEFKVHAVCETIKDARKVVQYIIKTDSRFKDIEWFVGEHDDDADFLFAGAGWTDYPMIDAQEVSFYS